MPEHGEPPDLCDRCYAVLRHHECSIFGCTIPVANIKRNPSSRRHNVESVKKFLLRSVSNAILNVTNSQSIFAISRCKERKIRIGATDIIRKIVSQRNSQALFEFEQPGVVVSE